MSIQLFRGYFNLQPGLCFEWLFTVQLPACAFIAVLAITVQVLVNHKYVAYFVMIVYYVATITAATMGLDHPMLMYGVTPELPYSDMNGFGHFMARERWYELYWTGAAIVLLVLAVVFWPRGTNEEWRQRASLAMAYYDGLSHAEVAGRMAQPLGTVKSWIRRGLQSLRDCLDRAARAALPSAGAR